MKKIKKYIYTLFISLLFFNIFNIYYAKQLYTVSCPELVSNRNNIEDKYHLDFGDKIEIVEELSNQISKTIKIKDSQELYTYFYNDLINYNIYTNYQKYLKDNKNITKTENNYITIARLLKHQKTYKDFFDKYTKDFYTDKETDKEKLIDVINYFLNKDIKYDYENPNNNNEIQIQTLQENRTKCHGGTALLSYMFDKLIVAKYIE